MSKQRRNNASPGEKKKVHYEGYAFATCTRQWQKKDFEALLANKYVVKHEILHYILEA